VLLASGLFLPTVNPVLAVTSSSKVCIALASAQLACIKPSKINVAYAMPIFVKSVNPKIIIAQLAKMANFSTIFNV